MMSWQCRWIDGVIINGEKPQSTQTIAVSLHGCEHLVVLRTEYLAAFSGPEPLRSRLHSAGYSRQGRLRRWNVANLGCLLFWY